MSTARRSTTKVSTKGQVVLPRAIRDQPGFAPGSELEVRLEEGRVVLAPVPLFERYTLDDLVGVAKYAGQPLSIEDMDRAIDEELADRHARGRY